MEFLVSFVFSCRISLSFRRTSADASFRLGLIAAVVWFPLGIGLCLLDRTVTCKRCGAVIKAKPSIQLGGSNRRSGN